MKKLNSLLKTILVLLICVLLILFQLFIINFIFVSIQNLILMDKNYLLLTNNSLYKYAVIFVIISTLLIIMLLNKKGYITLNDDIEYLSKFMCNKIFTIIFTVLSLIIFSFMIFNFDAVYEDKIVSHSIFNIKGIIYKYEDIKEVEVKIKKYWNGSMDVNYILIFDEHKVDVLGSVIDFKNEEDSYDHNLLIDDKIKELGIIKNVNEEYLDTYTSSLDKVYADKIKILFEKN